MPRQRQRSGQQCLCLRARLLAIAVCPATCLTESVNTSVVLQADRKYATERWRNGQGLLWFQHLRRAGGTSLCHLLRSVKQARFLVARGEACQPEEWKLRDALAVVDHNVSLLAAELRVLGGNAFAQEYGALPAQHLLGHRRLRGELRDWVFVTTIRDPWARFWSQLRHEMAPCLQSSQALAVCLGGNHHLLGWWWSPSAHIDSILGVPGFRLSEDPHVYSDNYYTRMLINNTDSKGSTLTDDDFKVAKTIMTDRMSAVIIMEDFARSALQLACALGLDLAQARSLLRTRIRPYERNQAMMDIPTESELGPNDVTSLRSRFMIKNRWDYGLYQHAQQLSAVRLARCARNNPVVAELRASAPARVEEVPKEEEPSEISTLSVDDMFGCTGGSLEEGPEGFYILKCPRSAEQASSSWWSPLGMPKRKPGQKMPGAECWKEGFEWSMCCDSSFGPEGNTQCWDDNHNFTKCCAEGIESSRESLKNAVPAETLRAVKGIL